MAAGAPAASSSTWTGKNPSPTDVIANMMWAPPTSIEAASFSDVRTSAITRQWCECRRKSRGNLRSDAVFRRSFNATAFAYASRTGRLTAVVILAGRAGTGGTELSRDVGLVPAPEHDVREAVD